MGLESILAIVAILVTIGIYYAGVRQGKRQERQRQEHDRELERERQAMSGNSKRSAGSMNWRQKWLTTL